MENQAELDSASTSSVPSFDGVDTADSFNSPRQFRHRARDHDSLRRSLCSDQASRVIFELLGSLINDNDEEVSVAAITEKLRGTTQTPVPTVETFIRLLERSKETTLPIDVAQSIWTRLTKRRRASSAISTSTIRHLEGKRKQTESDLQLLQNRISLLELEESRAWHKISKTKEKAQEILHIRQSNLQHKAAIDNIETDRHRHLDDEKQRQHSARKESTLRKRQRAVQALARKYQEVEVIKEERRKLREERAQQQQQAVAKAKERAEAIRKQEAASRLRRKQQYQQASDAIALRMMKKAIEEERQLREQQAKLFELEQRERKMIERLEGTQTLQQEAFAVLEQAMLPPPKPKDASLRSRARPATARAQLRQSVHSARCEEFI